MKLAQGANRIAGVAIVLGVILCGLLAFGCADTQGDTKGDANVIGAGLKIAPIDPSDLTGGVAAEVGDVKIGENAITAYLNNFRYAEKLQDDQAWGQWIYDAGYSMDGLRADTVEYFVSQELVRQAASEEGISATDAEVDERIAEKRAEATDEEYVDALDQQGLDEVTYRENVRVGILQEKLLDKIVGENDVDESQLLEYLKLYYPDDTPQDLTSLEGVDEERIETVRNLLKTFNSSQAFSDWMQEYRDKIKVTTHMMPEGLPYVVDLMPFEEAARAENNASDSSSSSESPEVDGDDAEDSSASSAAEGTGEQQ